MKYIAIAFAVVLAAGAPPSLGAPVLTDLEISLDGEMYVASARLIDGLTTEILEEIDSGLETTIGYRLRVHRRRPGLPDPTIAKHRVLCTVRRDALTRQYTLTRRIDGNLQETKVSTDPGEMREFMTRLLGLPVVPAELLENGEAYYLKARSDLGLVWRFYLIPWRQRTPWSEVPVAVREGHGDDAAP